MTRPRTTLGLALARAGLIVLPPRVSSSSLVLRRRGTARPLVAPPPAAPRPDYFRDELPVPPPVPPFETAPRYRAAEIKSAVVQPHEPRREPPRTDGPAKYTGEMVWLHKTAPVLEIHGKPRLTPADYAAGRRR